MGSAYEEDHVLHWSFRGTHILLPGLRLSSFGSFTAASLFVIAICFSERFLSFISEQEWRPPFVARSRWQNAFWKTALYWVITLLRLLYMLCAMSFHFGLLLVIVTSLAVAHLLIEVRKDIQSSDTRGAYSSIEQPFHDDTPNHHLPSVRLRSKSKPNGIFIHPQHSNLARADAAALQLGLGGPTERVSGSVYQLKEEASWKTGTGKDVARALLGGSHQQLNTNRYSFDVGSDSDCSDSEM
ncbi:copper transporter [Lentinula edodes]|uniref:copper transporter n=1 Tax=Lentinula edodes TaxID=5353 RepID=UPI001E8DC079|nr:copper transporter [Lentinula edodes]KAH7881052.1 copper transporter [Lentinula edodes]